MFQKGKMQMAKAKTSGAGVINTRGLSFKSIPKTENAQKNNARKVSQALKQGKTVVFQSSNGNIQTYKRNSDRTYEYQSSSGQKQTLSEEMGKSSIASFFVSTRGTSKYAIK